MISKDDVRYIGHLARIHLSAEEIVRFTSNLEDILRYIEKLKQLDITKVTPTSHVLPLKNVYREDSVKPSLKQAEVLAMANHKQKGFFKVPQVIE